MQDYQCKICGNILGNQPMIIKEMMFNFFDEFVYFKCSVCGCLQIEEPPENLAEYYPTDKYYSYNNTVISTRNKIKNITKLLLAKSYLSGFIPSLFPSLFSFTDASLLILLKKYRKTSAILDIGCGNGNLLKRIHSWGFKNLTGIDLFIEKNISYQEGINIYKQSIYDHKDKYKIIMMHHSFEHMEKPLDVLKECYKLLVSDGRLFIRIPMSDCFAYRKYGVNWYQIDAPRHFFLHTKKSVSILADLADFDIEKIEYDSLSAQFTVSEAYSMKNMSCSSQLNINSKQQKLFRKQSKLLNNLQDGDQACFTLKKRISGCEQK